jgi:CRISPR-associated endonuclease Cas1
MVFTTAMMTHAVDPARLTKRTAGVLVLNGYALKVFVERGHLCFEDGAGRNRRTGRLSRVENLKRLVVLGHSGSISLDALRWLRDIGAFFVQIDLDGTLIAATYPSPLDDARLRRAQAFAVSNGRDLEIARTLIDQKVAGQLHVSRQLKDSQTTTLLSSFPGQVRQCKSLDALLLLEAQAAGIYWKAWENVSVTFFHRDRNRVPEHWLEFGNRISPFSRNARNAATPANAMLNYLYAILEAEAHLSLIQIGLDPGMGIFHADERRRNSLACDIMEPIRPNVDAYVLELLASRAFKKGDFFETREGVCRVMPSISRQLMATGPMWAEALHPVVESVVQAFYKGVPSGSKSTQPMGLRSWVNRNRTRNELLSET